MPRGEPDPPSPREPDEPGPENRRGSRIPSKDGLCHRVVRFSGGECVALGRRGSISCTRRSFDEHRASKLPARSTAGNAHRIAKEVESVRSSPPLPAIVSCRRGKEELRLASVRDAFDRIRSGRTPSSRFGTRKLPVFLASSRKESAYASLSKGSAFVDSEARGTIASVFGGSRSRCA